MAKNKRNSRVKQQAQRMQVLNGVPGYALAGLAVAAVITGLGGWLIFSGAANADPAAAGSDSGKAGETFMPVRNVIVEGELRHADIKQLEKSLSRHVNTGFFDVDVNEIESVASEVDWVRSAAVRRVWPDTLKVYISEHQAYAAWNSKGLINRHGELFIPENRNTETALPQLRGPEGMHETLMAQYQYLAPVISRLGFNIALLEMDDRFAWRVQLDNGVSLLLGREQVNESVKRFADVFGGRFARNMDDINQVDLRYTNGFAIKWKSKKVLSGNNKAGTGRGNS